MKIKINVNDFRRAVRISEQDHDLCLTSTRMREDGRRLVHVNRPRSDRLSAGTFEEERHQPYETLRSSFFAAVFRFADYGFQLR